MFTDNASGTAPFLVGLKGNLFPIVGGRRIVRVVVAGSNANEENTKGRNGGGENSETCFDRGPDCDRSAEPCKFLSVISYYCFRGRIPLTGKVLNLGNVDQFRGLDECSNGRAERLSLKNTFIINVATYMIPILIAREIPTFSRFFISRFQRTAHGRRARITSMHPEYATVPRRQYL